MSPRFYAETSIKRNVSKNCIKTIDKSNKMVYNSNSKRNERLI